MQGSGFFDFQEKLVSSRTTPTAAPREPAAAMSVSELTAKIDAAIRTMPTALLVRGEVTNFKPHGPSGHLYFTLKDAGACISCAMFKNAAAKLQFQPADGMELLARGNVRVYRERGQYQFYVDSLQPLGAGALELAFQQLKAKLEAEGLFESARKRRLPKYPRRLVLVTSRQTAALQDMLKVLGRFPWVQLYIYHVPVQGAAAGPQIAAGLRHLNDALARFGGADAILLGRGGGSLEDLWAFNDEAVARAVAAMKIPVITGIGHEVDVAIADLVADYHAHTPTEAAQVAMMHWRAVTERIVNGQTRLARAMTNGVGTMRHRLGAIERHELFRRPLDRVHRLQQRLDDRERAMAMVVAGRLRQLRRRVDDLATRLDRNRPSAILARWKSRLDAKADRLRLAQQRRLRQLTRRLTSAATSIARHHPKAQIALQRLRLDATGQQLSRGVHLQLAQRRSAVAGLLPRLDRGVLAGLARRRSMLEAIERHLRAVGPDQVVARGFSITLKRDGSVVRHASDVRSGDRLVTRLADGQVESTVDDPKQPKLFE